MLSRDFCEISKNAYFVENLRTAASNITGELVYLIKTFSITIHAGLFTSFLGVFLFLTLFDGCFQLWIIIITDKPSASCFVELLPSI